MAPRASPWKTSGTVAKEAGWLPPSPSAAALRPDGPLLPDRRRHQAPGVVHREREVLHVAPEQLPDSPRPRLLAPLLRQGVADPGDQAGRPGGPRPPPPPR